MLQEDTDFEYKTKPYQHQHDIFVRSRDEVDWAYLMEMGTGKSKVTLDVAAYLFAKGEIDFLLIVAPNGVHENWIEREIPLHLPDWTNWKATAYKSWMVKAEERKLEHVLEREEGRLSVLSMNVEAFGVPEKYYVQKAKRICQHVTRRFRVMIVLDESSKIKTPGAKRTRRLQTVGNWCRYRRILTGTPVTNGPLDLYAQFKFLGAHHLGYSNMVAFKAQYSEWTRDIDPRTGEPKPYEILEGYKNLDELIANVNKISSRVTKDECLDLPPKVYARRKVYLEDKQRRLYDKLRKDSILELQAGGKVTVRNVLTKMLRLQQVANGFVPNEEDEPAESLWDDPMKNPRMRALLDCIQEVGDTKVIIWARFQLEIQYIADMLRKHYSNEYGRECVEVYYGNCSHDDRKRARHRILHDDSCRFIVGQPHSGGYGLDFTSAPTCIYYSNDFSLEARLQSEDRIHRIGQRGDQCLYVDFEGHQTVDQKIIKALRDKKKLADLVTQDDVKEWL